MKIKTFSPQQTFLSLLSNGDAEKVAGGEAFWKLSDEKKDSFGTDWLISEYNFNGNWEDW